jgi:hypothetical protein
MSEAVEAKTFRTSPLGCGVNGESAPLFNLSALRIPLEEIPLRLLPPDSSLQGLCVSPAPLPQSLTASSSASSQMNETFSTNASYPRSNPLEDFFFGPSLTLSFTNQ